MNEEELLKDASETVDGAVSGAVSEAASEAEEVVADAAESAEETAGEIMETAGETADEAAAEIAEKAEEAFKTADIVGSNIEKNSASKKTTVVLISIIVVLVALIVVFAVLLGKKFFGSKDNGDDAGDNGTEITSTVDPAGTTDTDTINVDPVVTGTDEGTEEREVKEYNVTVELGQYKGIEVDFPEISITEEQIDAEMETFIEDLTEDVPVDRPAQKGDVLNISYVGYMDGEEFDGGKDDDVDMTLGDYQFFPDFEDGLVGKEVGEHTLELTFPEDYYEELAGKPVTFVITINSIAETVVPELSDQLVADNTEFETIAEYRAYLKGQLEEEATTDAEESIKNQILDIAVQNATYGGEIDEEIEDLTQQYIDYYDQMAQSYYGVSGAELFNAFYGVTEEEYTSMLREESGGSVKIQHFLDKVAEAEGLGYTEEEYQTEFEEIFYSYYGFTEEAEVREQLSDEEIEKIVSKSIKQRKAQDLIIDSAIINR